MRETKKKKKKDSVQTMGKNEAELDDKFSDKRREKVLKSEMMEVDMNESSR